MVMLGTTSENPGGDPNRPSPEYTSVPREEIVPSLRPCMALVSSRQDTNEAGSGAKRSWWSMSDVQRQARALGDPTRHALFRYIADADRPVDVAELAAHLGLHPNAIRQHLAKLVGAGLVAEATAPPVGRGRPRLCYTLDASVESRWGVPGPYERLAVLLTEIIRSGDSPLEVGRRAERQTGSPLGEDTDPVAGLLDAMARHGFEPTAERRGDQVDVVLGACAFETAALADPDTVCGLHLGLAIGAADSVGGLEIDELIPHDPRHGACCLRCHVES
jgi:predicted ArsR family transcriptional regulator